MDMILRNITLTELADMFARHETCSSAPHLVDPAARQRARRNAKQNGVWARIERDLRPDRDIPVIKRSDFRQFRRTGDRTRHQGMEAARSRELELAALALWLGHPQADLDYLQDLLWAYCDDWTWIMAAHEYCSVDRGRKPRRHWSETWRSRAVGGAIRPVSCRDAGCGKRGCQTGRPGFKTHHVYPCNAHRSIEFDVQSGLVLLAAREANHEVLNLELFANETKRSNTHSHPDRSTDNHDRNSAPNSPFG